MSDLRLDGTAEDGAVVAVFDDGRELVIVRWQGAGDDLAQTRLLDINFGAMPPGVNLTGRGYVSRDA